MSEIAGYELLVALLPTALIPTVARDSESETYPFISLVSAPMRSLLGKACHE
jgi:hypothetical protein